MQWRDRLAISACAELWWGQEASSLSQYPEEHGSVSPQAGWAPGSSAQGRALAGGESRWSRLSGGFSETSPPPRPKLPFPTGPFLVPPQAPQLPGLRAPRAHIGMVTPQCSLPPACFPWSVTLLTSTLTASAPLPTTVPDLSPLPDPV